MNVISMCDLFICVYDRHPQCRSYTIILCAFQNISHNTGNVCVLHCTSVQRTLLRVQTGSKLISVTGSFSTLAQEQRLQRRGCVATWLFLLTDRQTSREHTNLGLSMHT